MLISTIVTGDYCTILYSLVQKYNFLMYCSNMLQHSLLRIYAFYPFCQLFTLRFNDKLYTT